MKGYLARLRLVVAEQAHWRADMLSLHGLLPDEMIDELLDLGPDGVEQVCTLAQMTDDELSRAAALYAR